MSAKFLDSISGKLADQWVATLFTPAFVFWAGGAIVVLQKWGWNAPSQWFVKQPEPLQIALLVAVLLVITASAFIIQRFDLAVLQFLEGYGALWLRPLQRWGISQQAKRYQRISDRWQHLSSLSRRLQLFQQLAYQPLTDVQREGAIDLILEHHQQTQKQPQSLKNTILTAWLRWRLPFLNNKDLTTRLRRMMAEVPEEQAFRDWQQQKFPLPTQLMPTRLGNILRAAERRPLEKYGLDGVICWPRLWLLLPEAAKKDIQEARADLNNAARFWLWSLLFIGWAGLGAWWAIPLGVAAALFAYFGWAIAAAITYGDLIEAAFDLYRHLLYDSLRWKLPPDPNEERRVGRQLTEYLWRGF